jgi:hypothetical protein
MGPVCVADRPGFQGPLHPRETRQSLRGAGTGDDAQVRLGLGRQHREPFAREPRVAGHPQLVSAAEGEAVVGADHRLREALDPV